MTGIVVIIGGIYRLHFKCSYINAKGLLRTFYCISRICINLEHFHKEMSPIAKVFMTVLALKDVLTYMYKRSCFCSKRVKVQKMFNQNILCFSSESHGIRDTKV